MKRFLKILVSAVAGLVAMACQQAAQNRTFASGQANTLVIHPVPKGIYYAQHNDDYTVKVRVPGGEWQDLYEYKVKVDMDAPVEASMVYFDFAGEVEVAVRKNNGSPKEVKVRPASAGVNGCLKNGVYTFLLDSPKNISVEFDGDTRRNLHVFTNAPETDVPSINDEGVAYFGPDVYDPGKILSEGTSSKGSAGLQIPRNVKVTSDGFVIPSDTYVYLAPGAVLKGTIICDSVKNVKIGGRGFLLTPNRGISVTYSEKVSVSDIVVINPRHYTLLGGQSRKIDVRNLRSFSYQGWSDGLDFMSSCDVSIDGVFMRNSDDCIAIYGPRWDYRGDTKNITVENSTLWADIAHPMNMGIHGYTADGIGNRIENVTFRNIDVLEHDEDDPPYQGCMAICCGDLNFIENILYEDIRIDNIEEGRLFNVEVVYNSKYCSAPGRGVKNVIFRNIDCADIPLMNASVLRGYDAERTVENVVFENVRIGGKRMTGLDGVKTNEFIKNIEFK